MSNLTDEERDEARAAGFRSAELYGNRAAVSLQGRDVGEAEIQRHLNNIHASLQLETQRLRENGKCEKMIAEYVKAVIEGVTWHLCRLRAASPSSDTRN